MTKREWKNWISEPPVREDSNFVEGYWIEDDLQVSSHRLTAFTKPNGELEWGHLVPDESSPYRWKKVTKSYIGWRYLGPKVPTRDQQRKHDASYVWRFHDAPGELASLSTHGGDEDWLVLLLTRDDRPGWTYSDAFGKVSEHLLPDGRCVLISAHS